MKTPKYFMLGLFAGLLVIVSSCELIEDLVDIEFTTGYEEMHITINPSSAGDYVFKEEYIKSELEQEIKDHGGSLKNLKEVKVNDITLEVISGEPDFSAFDHVEVYVSTPNFSNVLIGSAVNIVEDVVSVHLDATEQELKDILSEEEYLVVVSGALDKDIKETTELLLRIDYSVVVGP